MEELIRSWLEKIGEDPAREGLRKTPKRVSDVFSDLTSGYRMTLAGVVGNSMFKAENHDLVLLKDIPFFSLCEHHVLPFYGKAHVAYIPDKKILGLGVLPRIVDLYSRRLQVQERMTRQVAEGIQSAVKPLGVGVVVEGEHLCLMMRDVQKPGAKMVTATVLGSFKSRPETRAEFLSLLK